MIMSENKQLLDKYEEKVDPIRSQAYAQPVATGMDDELAKAAIGGKKTTIISEPPQPLKKYDKKVDAIPGQADAQPVGTGISNGLAKAAIAGLIGATLGAVAGALTNKKTAESINRTVKGVGDAVKGAAEGVASGINNAVKGGVDAAKGTSEGINDAVKGGVDQVKGVAEGINDAVKAGVDQVQDTVEDAKPAGNQSVKPSDNQSFKLYEERLVADKKQVKTAEVSIRKHVETQTAYISVPLKKERLVVEQTTPVNAVTLAAPGEANFHEGEIARMEVYEEKADVHKLAFVREEVSVRKEVDHNTVEVEDKVRKEELYLDSQSPDVIDKTKA